MKASITSNANGRAVAANIEALHGCLRQASRRTAEACKLVKHGEFNGAIGTIAGIDAVLTNAIALYRAALALHCIRRRTGPVTGNRRASTGKRERHD